MQKKYPFKFLDAYTQEDSNFFFGRNDEIEELYEMVFQTDLILVYGASGTGKTSLIQCGLASRFQSHDWLALYIRRGGDLNASFEKALQKAAGVSGDASQPLTEGLEWLDEDWSGEGAVAAPAKKLSPLARRFKAIYLRHFKPLYLIFDQFEELYTIENNRDEQQKFIETVKEILLVEQPVKIILSIREEYLGYLYEFERQVPELLRKKLRVEPMNLDKVTTVIRGVGSRKESNVRLQPGEENAIAEGIFAKIKGEEKTLTIELPYLQVFLDKLYLQITGDKDRKQDALFTLDELKNIGDIGDVLRNFLDEQVLEIAGKRKQSPDTIWQTLSPFATTEGTKSPLTEAQLLDSLTDDAPKALLKGDILEDFVKSRILRFSEHDQRFEVVHDSLAKQIAAKRSDEEVAVLEVRRMIKSAVAMKEEAKEPFTEKQLAFIEPYLGKFKPSSEEMAWVAHSKAVREAERVAKEERKKRELEDAHRQAEQERVLREQAEQAKTEAERQKTEADEQRKQALNAKKDAESQRSIAQQNEKQAKENELRARQRTRLAAIVSVIALGLALFGWCSYSQEQMSAAKANAALRTAQVEKAKRDLLDFTNMERKIKVFLDAYEPGLAQQEFLKMQTIVNSDTLKLNPGLPARLEAIQLILDKQ